MLRYSLQEVLGDKLVKDYMFESDWSDDPALPSPNQLKYKILIKNKKLRSPHTPIQVKQQRVSFVKTLNLLLSVI